MCFLAQMFQSTRFHFSSPSSDRDQSPLLLVVGVLIDHTAGKHRVCFLEEKKGHQTALKVNTAQKSWMHHRLCGLAPGILRNQGLQDCVYLP